MNHCLTQDQDTAAHLQATDAIVKIIIKETFVEISNYIKDSLWPSQTPMRLASKLKDIKVHSERLLARLSGSRSLKEYCDATSGLKVSPEFVKGEVRIAYIHICLRNHYVLSRWP